ncbi:hypothetical protein ACFVJM_39085 [Streptomyces virginiae]|uniref:hypothetical protein n=1 Tax=Streptomyces virginiae TaxID=1961 RepID=UPI0036263989
MHDRDRFLTGAPSDTDRPTAGLHHAAAIWNTQDGPLLQNDRSLARTLTRRGEI